MKTDCLEHTLTEEERIRFERDGYFVLEKVMSPAQVSGLAGAYDRIVTEACSGGQDPDMRFTVRDFLWRDPLFLDFVDWPATLPKVWGILGWNVQVYHTVLMYSPPEPGKTEVDFLGWHQDSGPFTPPRNSQWEQQASRARAKHKQAYAEAVLCHHIFSS